MLNTVAVLGQGYVGLPLALAASKSGYKVIGLDKDDNRIKSLNRGLSGIEDVKNHELELALATGRYRASGDFREISEANVVLICVPTPLDLEHQPDLDYLLTAVEICAKYLTVGTLVIIESTVAPGTTREVVLPRIEDISGLSRKDFYLAFSPERIDPNNKSFNLLNTPKLVAGLNQSSTKMAIEFYSKFINEVINCSSLEVAEIAKLLENSFRFINISFINELSIFCHKIGVNIEEIIKAASSKPYGFMPFYPSLGVGGHCIPVDPIYLSHRAEKVGAPIEIIKLAEKINNRMPDHFVFRAEELIGNLEGKKLLVVGVSYKPNVSDTRETSVKSLITKLRQKGAKVSWHDDLVAEWNGENSVDLNNNFDLAVIAMQHSYLDLSKLGNVPVLYTNGSF
jgi:UDP-N-acetyl-D-glucosamine dehydrogenase